MGALICVFAGCKATKRETRAELPASCTLLVMSPEERAIHERRLNDLKRAARLEQETAAGFEFSVDLRQMPSHELQAWMANEQKCCSFLRMQSRTDEVPRRAYVTVDCPRDFRDQVLATFGLGKGS
jgi:hypothetical protein